jgi:hypothetical protein
MNISWSVSPERAMSSTPLYDVRSYFSVVPPPYSLRLCEIMTFQRYCVILLLVVLIACSVSDCFVLDTQARTKNIRRRSSSTSLETSSPSPSSISFDPKYYAPPEQSKLTRNYDNSPSRITLTRFLSQYVKDHPEVSVRC